MMQFSLISLIPGLIRRLEDCADPEMDSYERNMTTPTSLKTSERSSCMNPRMFFLHSLILNSACVHGTTAANLRQSELQGKAEADCHG